MHGLAYHTLVDAGPPPPTQTLPLAPLHLCSSPWLGAYGGELGHTNP